MVSTILASLERERGHPDQALQHEQDSLRLSYAIGEPDGIASSHQNLAIDLPFTGDRLGALSHSLASAIIRYQSYSGVLHEPIRNVALDLASPGHAAPPASFAELCATVEQIPGVRFAELVAGLPTRAADGEAAFAEVLRLAREVDADEIWDLDKHVAKWEPVVSGIVAATTGDPDAAQFVEAALTDGEQQADWAALVGVLRRIISGETDEDLLMVLTRSTRRLRSARWTPSPGRWRLTPLGGGLLLLHKPRPRISPRRCPNSSRGCSPPLTEMRPPWARLNRCWWQWLPTRTGPTWQV